MPLADEADLALHARVLRKDARAFRVLVLRHEARLRAFTSRLAGNAAGDDIAQDVFLRAWDRAASWRGEGSYAGWLLGIAWHLFLDHNKRERRRKGYDLSGAQAEDVTTADPSARLDIDRLLGPLTLTERAAVILCEGHGWSQSEAAAILGLPLGTLKSTALRAKDKIRQAIARSEIA